MREQTAKQIRKKVYGSDFSRKAKYEVLWRKVLRWVKDIKTNRQALKTVNRGQIVSTDLRAEYLRQKKLYKTKATA